MSILSRNKLKNSGLIISLILFLLFFIFPLIVKGTLHFFPLIIIIVLILTSLTNPYLLRMPIKYWINIGNFLGKINSVLILFVFFYFIIVPASFLRYFINYLFKRKKSYIQSYYVEKENFEKTNFHDQY